MNNVRFWNNNKHALAFDVGGKLVKVPPGSAVDLPERYAYVPEACGVALDREKIEAPQKPPPDPPDPPSDPGAAGADASGSEGSGEGASGSQSAGSSEGDSSSADASQAKSRGKRGKR